MTTSLISDRAPLPSVRTSLLINSKADFGFEVADDVEIPFIADLMADADEYLLKPNKILVVDDESTVEIRVAVGEILNRSVISLNNALTLLNLE